MSDFGFFFQIPAYRNGKYGPCKYFPGSMVIPEHFFSPGILSLFCDPREVNLRLLVIMNEFEGTSTYNKTNGLEQ